MASSVLQRREDLECRIMGASRVRTKARMCARSSLGSSRILEFCSICSIIRRVESFPFVLWVGRRPFREFLAFGIFPLTGEFLLFV